MCQWHGIFRLVTGVAEHDALVASASARIALQVSQHQILQLLGFAELLGILLMVGPPRFWKKLFSAALSSIAAIVLVSASPNFLEDVTAELDGPLEGHSDTSWQKLPSVLPFSKVVIALTWASMLAEGSVLFSWKATRTFWSNTSAPAAGFVLYLTSCSFFVVSASCTSETLSYAAVGDL